jgi:hypothetical protein
VSNLVDDVLGILARWASETSSEIASGGMYVFGSLVHRSGAQFGKESDVDLVVLLPSGLEGAPQRTLWLEKLALRKQALEAELASKLDRAETNKPICSVVPVTVLDIGADIHKDGAQGFFSANVFRELATGKDLSGLPGAGSTPISERLVLECARFAQKKRNAFLGVNRSGGVALGEYDGADPLPKDVMRFGAMAQHLEDDAEDHAGAEYDVQVGLDFLFHRLYSLRKKDALFRELYDKVSVRRGARGPRVVVSGRDQVLLAEIILDACHGHLETLRARRASSQPSLAGTSSTAFFAGRFAQAFPGVREVKWFSDPSEVSMRMEKLLEPPLIFGDQRPVWWWRGGNMHISSFRRTEGDLYLLDEMEIRFRRIAAVNLYSYKHQFVYVESEPLEPTGLYASTHKYISEVVRGDSYFPYHYEEYGLVDGRHMITAGELDDGAAVIDGKLADVRGRTELRARYVTPYNFVIAAFGSPIGNTEYDEVLREQMDLMLKGEDHLEEIAKAIARLPVRTEIA